MTDQQFDDIPDTPDAGESAVTGWGRTWQGAALQPSQFFAALPCTGSTGPAILYYLSIGVAVAGADLFWSMLRGVDFDVAGPAAALGVMGAWSPLLMFLFSPLLLLVSLFFAAGVTHVLLRLFGGAGGDFGLTTRVFAYAYSPQILGVIPYVGPVAGIVWMMVCAVIGVREAHRTTTGRAAAAVLIPVAMALAFLVFVALMMAAGTLIDPRLGRGVLMP